MSARTTAYSAYGRRRSRNGLCAYQFDIFEQEDDVWHRAQETHEERIYEPAQLTAMLEQAGFTEIKTYGDQSLRPYRAARTAFTLQHEREINL